MATSTKTAATTSTRKTAAKRTTAKASAPAGNALPQLRLAGVAGKLLEGRRKDLQALIAANEKSYKGLQTVVKRQTDMLKAAIGEWRSVAKVVAVAGPRESIAQLDQLAVQAFKLSLSNIRELAELAARDQSDAFSVIQGRIRESVDEVSKLLKRE